MGVAIAMSFVVASLLEGCSKADPDDKIASAPVDDSIDVLVFYKTEGWEHLSIPAALEAMANLADERGWKVATTEDSTAFTDRNLENFDAVVFLLTTGDVLTDAQQGAFERYVQAGGGYAGVHSASDTEYDWPWYGELVGAYFKKHPFPDERTITVADRVHPSTAHLPERWTRLDEWYEFQASPRGDVHVLATLNDGEMGFDHPLAWCQRFDGGRSWYTAMGHTGASYAEDAFLEHLVGGVEWAAGIVEGDCAASTANAFAKTVLDDDTDSPMKLAVAPDGSVFYAERGGQLKLIDPTGPSTVVSGSLSVATDHEDGLLGLALDPDFADNHWIYLFYSPWDESENRLSRFEIDGDLLDLASEVVLLNVPTQRDSCCHTGGAMAFDASGALYVTTGDNTNPHSSSGFAPIDESDGNSDDDAQKASSNTMDLRGKILRIVPQDDGTYAIPDGNLFADAADGLPEIYAMGTRNPFTMALDPTNGWIYWGEVGPDAYTDSDDRGPRGYDEVNRAKAAGNFGWPYCIADNQAYIDYDFETEASGAAFDCAAPINDSPNNTGPTDLPPAEPALAWYAYGETEAFPEFTPTAGRSIMVGPLYRSTGGERDLPAYFDNTLFVADWMRGWIKEVKLDDAGEILKINDFAASLEILKPMHMTTGPDGALYLIDFGSTWGDNDDAQIVRLDYTGGG